MYTHFLFSKELVWENIADVMPTEAKEENGAFSVPLLAKSVSQTNDKFGENNQNRTVILFMSMEE